MSFSFFAEFHHALDELKKGQTGTVTTVPFASSCVMFHIVLLLVLVYIIIVHFSRQINWSYNIIEAWSNVQLAIYA